MTNINDVGVEWLMAAVNKMTTRVVHVTPVVYNEKTRFLPQSVSPLYGYIRYSVNPFMREILDCADINSPVRECYLRKGVQITWSTLLESIMLYYMGFVRVLPIMYVTADGTLAKNRIDHNVLPMLAESDMGHIIQSSDTGNTRKTGKTADYLQFVGGGYLVPAGSMSVGKTISYSVCIMLLDEVDTYPVELGQEGDPIKVFSDRCSGFWLQRKIFGGGTPKVKHTSKIDKLYARGDQREYNVRCRKCGYQQILRWSFKNGVGGFKWELNEAGTLVLESVRYCCEDCGAEHYEHDKEVLFSPDGGAEWVPTASPVEPDIRSYDLPGMYSPNGMAPWSKCVGDFLASYDPETRKVISPALYKTFRNNILGRSYEVKGSKIHFTAVSAHRRTAYSLGVVPNRFAAHHMGGPILFLTCTVDVHKRYLIVAVIGWAIDAKNAVVDYIRIDSKEGVESDECPEVTSSVWGKLRALIDEKVYKGDDGKEYRFAITLIDAGYSTDTVVTFCNEWEAGVYPILGRDSASKHATIKEFEEFQTKAGTIGYKINVDHYKDRVAPVLRREWSPDQGMQKVYHFNAPVDLPDAALIELTVETKKEKRDASGIVSYFWYRPHNANQHFWDDLIYAHAAVEIFAWAICIKECELDTIVWEDFWNFMLDRLNS